METAQGTCEQWNNEGLTLGLAGGLAAGVNGRAFPLDVEPGNYYQQQARG